MYDNFMTGPRVMSMCLQHAALDLASTVADRASADHTDGAVASLAADSFF